jgi:hypothetical protein
MAWRSHIGSTPARPKLDGPIVLIAAKVNAIWLRIHNSPRLGAAGHRTGAARNRVRRDCSGPAVTVAQQVMGPGRGVRSKKCSARWQPFLRSKSGTVGAVPSAIFFDRPHCAHRQVLVGWLPLGRGRRSHSQKS